MCFSRSKQFVFISQNVSHYNRRVVKLFNAKINLTLGAKCVRAWTYINIHVFIHIKCFTFYVKIYHIYIHTHIFIYTHMCAYKRKICSYVTKIFNILTFLQICLFFVFNIGSLLGLFAKRKKYFRTCETFQALTRIRWMKQVMKINPVATGTDREWITDFCILFHPLGPKIKPWFNVYTWAFLLRKNLGQWNKLNNCV